MLTLKSIKDYIQNIAESIATVIDIHVTIVDENLERIAGTGIYYGKIGTKIHPSSSFGISAKTKKSVVIENPGDDLICLSCKMKEDCLEIGEVCCPIIIDNEVYGVIGLIAFNEDQKQTIFRNKDQILNYLNKTADLISNKLKAEINTMMLKIEKKRLEQVINNIEKPVVSTDKNGKIDLWNTQFERLFNIKKEIKNKFIVDLIGLTSEVTKLFGSKINDTLKFNYTSKCCTINGIFNIKSIDIDDVIEGYTFFFTDNTSALKDYTTITNYSDDFGFNNIIGNSDSLNKAKNIASIASESYSTVLITGESGTGKELFARAIHNTSPRKHKPFIAINCAAIPEHLLESELFGYEEGSFSGAKKGGKPGKFELADRGTLFLDEIGDMSLHLQCKLLRVLQDKKIDRIGSCKNIPIDVRVICATNKNLELMVANNEFRDDLFYRLNVFPINIPPLRHRKEDIKILINYWMIMYSKRMNKNVNKINPLALSALLDYSWPGNVRELQNTIEYSIIMASNGEILYENLPDRITKQEALKCFSYSNKSSIPENSNSITLLCDLEAFEIRKALLKFKNYKKDKDLAAEALGISRATLYRKIKEYGIE